MNAAPSILPPRREPNGRHRREPRDVISVKEAKANRSVVLAQPHRQGDLSQHRVWAAGRAVLDGIVPDVADKGVGALLRAAERYSEAWAAVKATMDSARPLATSSASGRRDLTREEADEIRSRWSDIRRALRDSNRHGDRVQKAVDAVVLDLAPDFEVRCLNTALAGYCGVGLAALVDHFGIPDRGA